MPNNKRILIPRKRIILHDLFQQGKTNDEIRDILGRPELDVDWFRTWEKKNGLQDGK